MLFFFSAQLCFSAHAKKFTIMLSPEGDSTNPGRSLPEGFECGFTRQYAELLKETLEQDSNIRVIMSHESGEQISQYEKASFANRLEVDLYISINFYASEKPNISVYYYKSTLFEPLADATRLELYPTTKAYILNNEKTQKIAQNWHSLEKYQTQMCVNLPVALPIKQLEGITAPAFALDLSAQQIINIHMYIQPISNILTKVAHE